MMRISYVYIKKSADASNQTSKERPHVVWACKTFDSFPGVSRQIDVGAGGQQKPHNLYAVRVNGVVQRPMQHRQSQSHCK